ncbi:hypothetical protein [Flavobacteriaceae bacterium 14752]|uniref:hypothetical protein n=1 Tax=Mesohalobacter salilacus TaxID=2491711 RepID=UPI000F63CE0B|nr:hypothetical protein EIG84_11735 [Flavobacteriaceae bacterium 14752]
MNEAHWHLVVNHLPIIFPIVGIIIMVTGLISKSDAVKRMAYMIFIIGALASIAAMNTGEGAEDIAENISGVTENFIETHEESAEKFATLTYVLGGFSLVGLWVSFKQKFISNFFNLATIVFALVVLFFGKETGTTGGEIRHTEIRSGSNIPAQDIQRIENDDD